MSGYFLDPGIAIKEEPSTAMESSLNMTNITASMPIPARRLDISDYRALNFDLEASQSPGYGEVVLVQSPEPILWESKLSGAGELDIGKNEGLIRMDDDDIFEVDKADLIQGPTLAELNANDENLLADLNFDDLLLPEESQYNYLNNLSGQVKYSPSDFMSISNSNSNTGNVNNNTSASSASIFATSCPQSVFGFYKTIDFDFGSFNGDATPPSSSSAQVQQSFNSPVSPLQQKHSTLHELLRKDSSSYPSSSPDRATPGPSAPTPTGLRIHRAHAASRLSSSAPTHISLDTLWQRREPRKHLLSTGSLVEAGSTSSLSTGGVLSPEAQDLSHDELESDEDSEHYEDFSTDGDSDDDDEHHKGSNTSKKERFFWQYNVQAKGPKGQRLNLRTKTENPHVLNEITDPVFSPDCVVRGIKHSGKARKGDGNDLTPNPKKLYSIGKELDKLGRIINDMTPVSELPFNVRPKTRKEKNKLASRACRLKKKAQHEANKIKLQGLENEHRRLLNGIHQAKQVFLIKINNATPDKQEDLTNHVEKIFKSATKYKIAGTTTEYVNKILEKVKVGGQNITMEDCM